MSAFLEQYHLDEVVDKYFTGTSTRIGGLSLAQIEDEYRLRYEKAYGHRSQDLLETGGSFQYRADEGEHHIYDPQMRARESPPILVLVPVKYLSTTSLDKPIASKS